MSEYEYGIGYRGKVHRTGMTLLGATEWAIQAEDDGAKPGMFYVIRRPKSTWMTMFGDKEQVERG